MPSPVRSNRWRSSARLKSFGEPIAPRDPDQQVAEIHIRIALINRFNALGLAESERIAGAERGKGPPRGNRHFRNNAKHVARMRGAVCRPPPPIRP